MDLLQEVSSDIFINLVIRQVDNDVTVFVTISFQFKNQIVAYLMKTDELSFPAF